MALRCPGCHGLVSSAVKYLLAENVARYIMEMKRTLESKAWGSQTLCVRGADLRVVVEAQRLVRITPLLATRVRWTKEHARLDIRDVALECE